MAKWGDANIIISKIYQRDQTNKNGTSIRGFHYKPYALQITNYYSKALYSIKVEHPYLSFYKFPSKCS